MGTLFVFCTVFGHDKLGRKDVKNLPLLYGRGFDMVQGDPAPGTGGSGMNDDHIQV